MLSNSIAKLVLEHIKMMKGSRRLTEHFRLST